MQLKPSHRFGAEIDLELARRWHERAATSGMSLRAILEAALAAYLAQQNPEVPRG
jgi:hypothetical protein